MLKVWSPAGGSGSLDVVVGVYTENTHLVSGPFLSCFLPWGELLCSTTAPCHDVLPAAAKKQQSQQTTSEISETMIQINLSPF